MGVYYFGEGLNCGCGYCYIGCLLLLPDLCEVGRLRRRAGLTQRELARLVDVSQSLIAKVEAGCVNPSYLTVRRIFEVLWRVLDEKGRRMGYSAGDVHSSPVVFVRPADTVGRAVGLMVENGYSQLPVLDDGRNVGSISERRVMSMLSRGFRRDELYGGRVNSIMEPAFPTVDVAAPLRVVVSLLRYCHAVLTVRRGEVAGIITPTDIIKEPRGYSSEE